MPRRTPLLIAAAALLAGAAPAAADQPVASATYLGKNLAKDRTATRVVTTARGTIRDLDVVARLTCRKGGKVTRSIARSMWRGMLLGIRVRPDGSFRLRENVAGDTATVTGRFVDRGLGVAGRIRRTVRHRATGETCTADQAFAATLDWPFSMPGPWAGETAQGSALAFAVVLRRGYPIVRDVRTTVTLTCDDGSTRTLPIAIRTTEDVPDRAWQAQGGDGTFDRPGYELNARPAGRPDAIAGTLDVRAGEDVPGAIGGLDWFGCAGKASFTAGFVFG